MDSKLLYQLHQLSKVEKWTLSYNLSIFLRKDLYNTLYYYLDAVLNDFDLKLQKN